MIVEPNPLLNLKGQWITTKDLLVVKVRSNLSVCQAQGLDFLRN